MKKIIYSILFLIVNFCFSQTIKECEGFIDWRYNKNIKVFSDSEGKYLLDKIKNDNKNENYLFFKIIETNKNFLKVEIGLGFSLSDNISYIIGWIKKEKYLVTVGRLYSETSNPINLYSEPNTNSKIKSTLTYSITPEPYLTILDCSNGWLYVKYIKKNKIYEGWINPSDECANPYTTCG
jgi:hypothetical protein